MRAAHREAAGDAVAIILEAEGVLLDHHAVHRQAFNEAFSEIGLDCTNWSAPVRSCCTRKLLVSRSCAAWTLCH